MRKTSKNLTRHQFEGLLKGEWKEAGRLRKNGDFTTWIGNPWKFITDGRQTIRSKSWLEIAKALKLV